MTHFLTDHGLPLLFLAVMIESFGIPVPGETALIAFGVLASQGHYSIASVIAVAAAGAIVGDNLGYWLIGRLGGRALFQRWSWLNGYSERVLPRAERLMARHGGKVVFFGRFIAVLRVLAAFLAGVNRMEWRRFLLANASGGIVWATVYGLGAYTFGTALSHLHGPIGIGLLVVAALIIVVALRYVRSHEAELEQQAERALPGPLKPVDWSGKVPGH